MEWNAPQIEELYRLYQLHFDQLRQDVNSVGVLLGSSTPESCKLEMLTRAEFDAILLDPDGDRDAVELWIRRILRGHEHELPAFQAAG